MNDMDVMDVNFAENNAKKATQLIPAHLIDQERQLFSRVQASKKSPLVKLGELYDFMAKISKTYLHLTPCKKGCSSCCHVKVDVSDLEIQYIKKHAKKATKNLPQGLVIGDPCPFLKNNSCSIYEARPFFCRSHQVFTPTNRLCATDSTIGVEMLRSSEIDKSYLYITSNLEEQKFTDIRNAF